MSQTPPLIKYHGQLYKLAAAAPLKKGDKVRFKPGYMPEIARLSEIELGGQTGKVTYVGRPGDNVLLTITLDKHFPQLEDWENGIDYYAKQVPPSPGHDAAKIMQYVEKIK